MRAPLLIFHILGGTVSLVSGTAAMAVSKGGALHRLSGNIFTAAMLSLASSGLLIAVLKSQRGNMIASILTFYLIVTAWLAGHNRHIGLIDRVALVAGVIATGLVTALGIQALQNPGADKSAPAGMSFSFGLILLIAAAGDIRMIARGGIEGRQRILRHLWRMCFGLFIATGSFFLGQQQVFPASLRGSIFLTLLALLPFPLLIYWFFRVRFGKSPKALAIRTPRPAL